MVDELTTDKKQTDSYLPLPPPLLLVCLHWPACYSQNQMLKYKSIYIYIYYYYYIVCVIIFATL